MSATQDSDVAIIGGGIAGCASAYYLAKKGLAVTLLEKGEIPGEQSGRNWGFVRQQKRDPLEISPMMECIRLWQGLEAELEADIEWRQGGILHLAENDVEMAKYEAWLEHAQAYQLDSRKVSGREAAELLPGMTRDWVGGLYTPSDGQADPVKATTAFAKAAGRLGAEIHTGCIVEAIETAGGAVTGLRTEAGELRAKTVLVAAGAWTGRLLRTLGLDLPQLRVRSTVLRTAPARDKTALGVWCPQFGFRQRRDGSFHVGGGAWIDHDIGLDTLRHARAFWPAYRTQSHSLNLHLGRHFLDDLGVHLDKAGALRRQMRRDRVLSPAPSPTKVRTCLAAFRAMFPEFGDIALDTSWAGVIDVMPDEVPVFGEAPGVRGLVIATGFSGHGFGMGPITGKLMAELIAEGRASLDLGGFRFERFKGRRRADARATI
jgi:glycine/D-amino acid oxidase-like deaminating enzyme